MSAKKSIYFILAIILFFYSLTTFPSDNSSDFNHTWMEETIAKQLGWVNSDENCCGGYYVEPPFIYPLGENKTKLVKITSNHGLISQRGTSFLEEQVTVIRGGQEITANQAYVYRNKEGKLTVIDLIGDVHLREPNTLIVGKKGQYNFVSQSKILYNILYRTALLGRHLIGRRFISDEELLAERRVTALTAWGEASEFAQNEPRVYELQHASFTTCPPKKPAWQVKASHIVLNKNTGRGYATHARVLIKNIPIIYLPYISFSIDRQRKTGFLWPTGGIGSGSKNWGPYVLTPFYWNMAPNYDLTITPGFLTKRGLLLNNDFRYLSEIGSGKINVGVVPHDREFAKFQKESQEDLQLINPANQNPSITQAELNRLLSASTTRKAFSWRDDSRFNNHWFSHIDFNYAGDDYYLKNFGSSLNEISENQLLQEADLYYKSQHWYFTGRLQAYQTLHPIDSNPVSNQYRRLPQLILGADYPDQLFGLEYFMTSELTHFDFLKTPGTNFTSPIGNRLHIQPGISLPLYWPFFFINPRFQLALTAYDLQQVSQTNTPASIRRTVPIFDIASGIALNRRMRLFHHTYQQTLEPQIYYTYIPYRNQKRIPVFDTTVNTLVYDQIFNYNRFSGIDRIGDANQVGMGITTRLIDEKSGYEKIRLGVGGIVYFANRLVTLCNNGGVNGCTDNPNNHSNYQRLSPLSGMLIYQVKPSWNIRGDVIWNPITKQLNNTTLSFHYQPTVDRILNLAYSFARGGDILSGIVTNDDPKNNLKVTDFSFAWPVFRGISVVGRWSQNWNHKHLQNLLYGLQYDTCCWAARFVGGRAFLGLDPNNNYNPKYNKEFYIQFSLKGLGNIDSGNPSGLLSSITGYKTQFGQEI